MKQKIYGWTGKILRVNLTAQSMETDDTMRFANKYIGGRGMAAKIAWDEIKVGTSALSEDNILIIMTGPLTGTSAPFSGRTAVCSLSPQGYPQEWYTRSNFGGHWGPELKYAGWDGIIITGKADYPVYLWINNEQTELSDARPLWGLGIFETQKKLMEKHGQKIRVLTIGQAGENLSRIAIMATETESAAGQGGFGAVMGYKNLKAIVVSGTGTINIAQPERFFKICNLIREEAHGSHGWPHPIKLDPEKVKKYGQRFQACTQQCHTPCYDARFYAKVPGVICKKTLAGQIDCIAGLFPGIPDTFYNWKLGFEAGFEIAQMTNDLGINHWELLVGMIPWLRECFQAGKLKRINSKAIDLDNPYFWADLVKMIAFREGIGDKLAEGTVRASKELNLGQEFINWFFPAWGYAGHWDGHGDYINHIFYPYWIVSALQWAMDTRDPISSGHGYVQNIMNWSKVRSPEYGLSWEEIMNIGQKLYGSSLCVDPRSSYQDKAIPAVWHGDRSVFKDSLPVDDQIFPRIYSRHTQDHFARAGDMEGPDFEYHLLTTATGLSISKDEFNLAAQRIINLERLISIKLHNRCRKNDETVIPYFEREEHCLNPFINKPMSLEREKFLNLMDEYYDLRGWDKQTGRPKETTLRKLGLAL
ncbi:MAG: aldehyde ferredoxin oxidoreductase N-terminal domain-containing protein [bacterium]